MSTDKPAFKDSDGNPVKQSDLGYGDHKKRDDGLTGDPRENVQIGTQEAERSEAEEDDRKGGASKPKAK